MSEKNERISDGITNVSDERAGNTQKKPKRRNSLAAILVIAILCGAVLIRGGRNAYAVREARYPRESTYPREEYCGEGDDFLAAALPELLSGAGEENRVCSPVNLYIGLSMLAEVSGGGTRDQLLALLGAENLTVQRERANKAWNANYYSLKRGKNGSSVLANSIWLNRSIGCNKAPLNLLAKNYYVSSFRGEMGSRGYDDALRKWLDDQTGGLLQQQTSRLSMTPQTVMAMVSTVCFKGTWNKEIRKSDTYPETFHGPSGDRSCDFMHAEELRSGYYWAERFSAIKLSFTNSRYMWFILPDEGVSMEELVNDPKLVSFLSSDRNEWNDRRDVYIDLCLPKFDVDSDLDLQETLQRLGVTDAFSPDAADFSPLTADAGVCVSRMEQAARVQIDEDGCTAATAYVAHLTLAADDPSKERIDFVLDRPFLFAITYLDQLPLFVGIVNDP